MPAKCVVYQIVRGYDGLPTVIKIAHQKRPEVVLTPGLNLTSNIGEPPPKEGSIVTDYPTIPDWSCPFAKIQAREPGVVLPLPR